MDFSRFSINFMARLKNELFQIQLKLNITKRNGVKQEQNRLKK
jgi:hypothetical protein